MAITYDKIAYDQIELGLRSVISTEFSNVYIGNTFEMKGTECIRIMVESSDNEETTNSYEQRVFNLIVRYYQKGDTRSEKVYESIRRKADRLRKHLIDNQVKNTTDAKWTSLIIDTINFNVEDEENEDIDNLNITEYLISVTHHNPI